MAGKKPNNPRRGSTGHSRVDIDQRRRRKKKKMTYDGVRTALLGISLDFSSFFTDLRTGNIRNLSPQDLRRKISLVSVVLVLLFAVVGAVIYAAVWSATNLNAQKIMLNGEPVGVIEGFKITPEDIYSMAFAKLQADFPSDTTLSIMDSVTAEPVHSDKSEFSTPDYVIKEIYQRFDYKIEAAVFYVNNAEIATVQNMSIAELIEESIKSDFLQSGINIVKTEFVDDVRVELKLVEKEDILSLEEAKGRLTSTTEAEKLYTVAPGDNLTIIADNAGMSLVELLKVNPDTDPAVPLQIGQVLTLSVPKPLISVKTTELRTFQEVIPKEIEYRINANQPRSYSNVLQQGRDGQDEVTAEIYRVNKLEEGERKIVSRRSIVEPIIEIIEVGGQG